MQYSLLLYFFSFTGTYHLDISQTPHTRYTVIESVRSSGNTVYETKPAILMMSAAYTNLTHVPTEALELISSTLEFLSLKGNNFSSRYVVGSNNDDDDEYWANFPRLPQLRELDLRNCEIAILMADTFQNLPGLQRLYMGYNQFGYIIADSFRHIPQLFHLDLSYNNIQMAIDNGNTERKVAIDPFSAIEQGLYLDDNVFENMSNLLFLDVSFTKILPSSARAFSVLPLNLQHLSLCYTSFSLIPAGMFRGTRLRVLDISGNPTLAVNLQTDSLDGLAETLEILTVEDANIKSLHWFSKLKKLGILLLGNNNINQVYSDTFIGLDSIEMLDLSSNHLGNWYSRVFQGNPRLKLLKLRNNNINLITTEMFRDFEQLDYLALGNNDFICTCQMRDFIDVAIMNSRQVNCTVTEKTTPNLTLTIADQILNNYRPSIISINEDLEMQQKFCFGYKWTYDFNERIMHENMVNMQKSYDNIAIIKSNTLMYNIQIYEHHSTTSDHLEIQSKTFKMFDNNLLNFSFQLLDYDESEYKCINSTSNLQYTLTDIDSCSQHYNEKLPAQVYPTFNLWWILAIVFGILVLYGLIYYKWWHIRFFCISLRNVIILSLMDGKEQKSSLLKNIRINELGDQAADRMHDQSYNYDVFVSYCDENRNWILNEFLPNIDQCRDIKVCLHERDFQVS